MGYLLYLRLILSWGGLACVLAFFTTLGLSYLLPETDSGEIVILIFLHLLLFYSIFLEKWVEAVKFLFMPVWGIALVGIYFALYEFVGWGSLFYSALLTYSIYYLCKKGIISVSLLNDFELISFPKKQELLQKIKFGTNSFGAALEREMLINAYLTLVSKSHERFKHNMMILQFYMENHRDQLLDFQYEELHFILEEMNKFVQYESRRSNLFILNRKAYSIMKQVNSSDL